MDTIMEPFRIMKQMELRFNEHQTIPYMTWFFPSCFVFSTAYLVIIFGGTYLMRDKEPFQLRRALCMWSTGLSAFSFIALFKTLPWAYERWQMGGLVFLNCDLTFLTGSSGVGLWSFMFMFSKLPELGDTFFIVLRKGHISFLHWYHHISVMCYTWWSYAYPIAPGIMFGMINYMVHAIMYAYYAVKASGRNPPRWVARCITILQLSQMFLGIFWNYVAVRELWEGRMCAMNYTNVQAAIVMYVSYAILFANFYYWTYIKKKPKKGYKASPEKKEDISITSAASDKEMLNGSLPQNGFIHHRTVNH